MRKALINPNLNSSPLNLCSDRSETLPPWIIYILYRWLYIIGIRRHRSHVFDTNSGVNQTKIYLEALRVLSQLLIIAMPIFVHCIHATPDKVWQVLISEFHSVLNPKTSLFETKCSDTTSYRWCNRKLQEVASGFLYKYSFMLSARTL